MASVVEGDGEGLESAAGDETPRGSPSTPTRQSTTGVGRYERPPSVVIIREIYDSENAYENFEQQLERALSSGVENIVIEPFKLGDETARWISVGNCLHKTAVMAGFGAIVAGFVWPDKPFIFVPASLLSTLCTGLYSISWQFDPCCKYQVETDPRRFAQLSLRTVNPSSPVVLVRKDDTRRKVLHTAITLACLTQTGLKLYYPLISQLFGRASRGVFSPQQTSSSSQIVLAGYPTNYEPRGDPISNSASFLGFNRM